MIAALMLTTAAAVPAIAGPAESDAASADDRRICRTVSTVGTRLRERTCMTRAQWRARDRSQSSAAKELTDRESDGRNKDGWYGPSDGSAGGAGGIAPK
ncbi:hypothetical protein [Allosphingosinicella sp.]|jgi:hypothetical protein|uniref:hypothetical protein n=1 Tax=Allosphingosinicella sp. TaxID=2823234 RepID=UPI002EDF899D